MIKKILLISLIILFTSYCSYSQFDGKGNFISKGNLVSITNKTADYQLTETDYTVTVTCTSVDITITLPDATLNIGKIYNVYKKDATLKKVIIDGYMNQTINGELTYLIEDQYYSMTLQSDGENWIII